MEEIRKIEKIKDLMDRLDYIYHIVDVSKNKIEIITNLLKHYISEEADVNEYKTILIISKDFFENRFIYYFREELTTKMNFELRKNSKLFPNSQENN